MSHHLHDVSSLILHLKHNIIDSRLAVCLIGWFLRLGTGCWRHVLIPCIALLRDAIVGLTEGLKHVRRLSQDPSKFPQVGIVAEHRKQNACSQPVPSRWLTHTDGKTID
jgi:hypothetical protein